MPRQATTEKDSTAGVTLFAPSVTCNDGDNGIADFSTATTTKDAGIYAPLVESGLFEQAYLSLGVITWPNGADRSGKRIRVPI